MNARERWYADYRAFRTAARMWRRFGNRLERAIGMCVPSFVLSSPDGDYTRLHGDRLGMSCFGHMGQVTHISRMSELRRRVRLPA